MAMKATYCEITLPNGTVLQKEIYKDPKTVVGMPKKSLRGLIMVVPDGNDSIKAVDQVTPEQEASEENLLHTVFEDGKLMYEVTLDQIRKRRNIETNKIVNA